MPTVLVTHRATVTQNLLLSSLLESVTITSTHHVNPQRDGQAELAQMTGSNTWY